MLEGEKDSVRLLNSRLVKCCVKVKGDDIEAVIDTGAGICAVSPRVLERFFQQDSFLWKGPAIVVADQRQIRPTLGVNLSFIFNNREVEVKAVVLNLGEMNLLLGNDALAQMGQIQIDYKTDPPTFTCEKNEESDRDQEMPRKIVNAQTVTVPRFSVMYIGVRGNTQAFGADSVHFLPNDKLMADKGLSVGNAIMKAGCELLPIVNFTPNCQWLQAGTTVGTVEATCSQGTRDSKDAGANANKHSDFNPVIGEQLSTEERERVNDLLGRYRQCFSNSNIDLGQVDIAEHAIDTGNAQPIYQPPYASSFKQRELVQEQVKEMLASGVIEPAAGPWASPIVLVRKNDGTIRFCVDYRQLNKVTVQDVYPLPRIEDALSLLEGSKYFTSLDMKSGFWQIKMRPEDRSKTAFVTADGLFQFKVLPCGLVNSPRTFQRVMDVLLAGLKRYTCLVYIDDIVIFGRNFTEHLLRLETILERVQKAGIKLNLKKCRCLETRLLILGHIVDDQGVRPNPAKIAAVDGYPEPKTVTEIQRFLGICNYYRRFIKDYAKLARPLSDLTKKNRKFLWNSEQRTSFNDLKRALIAEPLLHHPVYDLPMEVHCDASGYGLGAILVQKVNDKDKDD